MNETTHTRSLAVFCDFENVALGVRDAKLASFDIRKVLERLLLKGNIVVKKAYCDWERYKEFKPAMHEASFELIEIPHVSMSGKNSADIRMVVDALDLCYTKPHVDTFEPGARSAWHTHPLGQTLILVSGLGWTQCWREPKQEIRPGDVITCPPGKKHWHGATPTTAMSHIAIQEHDENGKVVEWMEKVSDEQYLSALDRE